LGTCACAVQADDSASNSDAARDTAVDLLDVAIPPINPGCACIDVSSFHCWIIRSGTGSKQLA
jgi:hypothetical protein